MNQLKAIMSSRDRALSIIELLATKADGLPLSEIADQLRIPRSATHRLLADLRDTDYVRQEHDGGPYRLTVKLISLSLAYSNAAGITDLIRPILDQFAEKTGELAMICVLEGSKLMRASKAQGARQGLQYNPAEIPEVYLAATANGHALLSCFTNDEALQFVAKQGLSREGYGPNAPQSFADLVVYLEATRKRGYAWIKEVFEAGTTSIAAPIFLHGTKKPIGTVSLAGPVQRMTDEKIEALAVTLLQAAEDLSLAASRTTMFSLLNLEQ